MVAVWEIRYASYEIRKVTVSFDVWDKIKDVFNIDLSVAAAHYFNRKSLLSFSRFPLLKFVCYFKIKDFFCRLRLIHK